ncbi:hypothetical protein [Daejeonella oryzae]|nr:hypothetical protein [Daejeonella oryzae]
MIDITALKGFSLSKISELIDSEFSEFWPLLVLSSTTYNTNLFSNRSNSF